MVPKYTIKKCSNKSLDGNEVNIIQNFRATGFTTMKIGKFAAFAVGGSIILLEIAHQEGLIKINWTKLDKSVDKLADKVEASLGREKNWKDKV